MRTFNRAEVWGMARHHVVGASTGYRVTVPGDVVSGAQLAVVAFRFMHIDQSRMITIRSGRDGDTHVFPDMYMDRIVMDDDPIRRREPGSLAYNVHFRMRCMQCFVPERDFTDQEGRVEESGPYAFHLYLAPR